jgi:hypothetical protein
VKSGFLLRIPKPTTTQIHRQHPGRLSIGDVAETRVDTGLLSLLTSQEGGSDLPLGAGVLPELLACHGIAGAAACVVLGDTERKQQHINWSGATMDLTWKRSARQGEPLLARAQVSKRRAMSFLIDVETLSAATNEVLMTGQFQFVAVRNGRAVLLEDDMLLFEDPAAIISSETRRTRPSGFKRLFLKALRRLFLR